MLSREIGWWACRISWKTSSVALENGVDQRLSSHFLIHKNSKQRNELHNIELDIRGTRDTPIELMNCTIEEVISIARSMIW